MGSILRLILPWAAPVTAMAVMSISLSLTIPLFALLLEREGVSGTLIGLNHTVGALFMVLSAPILPALLARVGVTNMMIGATLALAAAMLAIPLIESPWWWAALRPVFGFAANAIFFASEYWIVSQAPDATRGRIVGVYVLILSASYMVGPLILGTLGIEGMAIYVLPAIVFVVAAIPVWLGRHGAPEAEPEDQPSPFALLRFFRTDPMIVWGVVLFGVIEFGAMGLMAVWGLRSGFDEADAVRLVFWLAAGSLAFQLPIGWAADTFDRRRLLAVVAMAAALSPLMMALTSGPLLAAAGVFVMGGAAVAFYSVALVELGARYKGAELAKGNAVVVLAYGLGALFSPGAFGAAMDAVPPDGLLWLAALAACAYLALSIVRIRRADRRTLDRTGETST
jgi:MFS family permease